MDKLTRGASGLRHLRWAREIYATLAAHVEHSGLDAEPKKALRKELGRLDNCIQELSGAVKAYRDFLERERVRYRGAIRAATFEQRASKGDRLGEATAAMERESLPRQRTLKAALELAIAELRAHLSEMDTRIAGVVSEAFVDNLYPPLTKDRSRVADVGDDDDDAAGRDD
ncbi:hypothetical protein [Polyangium jinanense]|uniref:Uncharacterized protein n=1 Tax=Polyangium jinanense TaxID=2829994 RepID=A0A9X4AYW9_9BACT|nr:hypothetical protein [Polyangium jinanense]MDC3957755.1 hypothetical protein [Polyangium jinanense]MDC3987547.1 hypothetical protein [Polyangium jinanense]